ncbi:hypothetical protein Rsub_07270 [Raphidocelis subcapitata]|uniref:SOUL heme-binding protein n=1 Tax=Raphidocelis subcapitata TaxID=307507 RepID=A0A2V0P508_9CHLO|nr:hypothetical protein Rsub_07270 [Raphidocelis subcapitata]|eukprot:GBF94002.1 hypothetical protein Rsub_07270 [Raphidocelis subcapitata]
MLLRGSSGPATSAPRRQQQQPRPTAAGRRKCTTVRAAGGGEGLFGLKGLFGGGKDAPPPQQQQQQQSQPQQPQPEPATAPPPPAARGVEFPPFQTVSKGPVYDLRFYEPYTVVEMDYRRRETGYLTLGQYQDGANADRAAFNLTQPVVMTYHPDGRKTMALMVGSPRDGGGGGGGGGAPPAPAAPGVRLGVAGGEVVAVLRFPGYITPAAAEEARQRLLAALREDGLQLAEAEAGGLFRVAQYGQVYTLEERLNELMLRVQL